MLHIGCPSNEIFASLDENAVCSVEIGTSMHTNGEDPVSNSCI